MEYENHNIVFLGVFVKPRFIEWKKIKPLKEGYPEKSWEGSSLGNKFSEEKLCI